MTQDFVRIVIVPIGLAVFVFFVELVAAQTKGTQMGKNKFKVWFNKSGEIRPSGPSNLVEVKEFFRIEGQSQIEEVLDISELVSIESYTGFGFDLVAAALTIDILSIFKASDAQIPSENLAGMSVLHLLALMVIAILVIANNRAKPEEREKASKSSGEADVKNGSNPSVLSKVLAWLSEPVHFRTCLAVLIGLISLITSLIFFWEAI